MNDIHLFRSSAQMLDIGSTFVSDAKERLGLDVDIPEKVKPHQWEKLPWRWIVERTLSWFNHSRRLSKDYQISVSSAEANAQNFSFPHFAQMLMNTASEILSISILIQFR